jgi:universal stress protein A
MSDIRTILHPTDFSPSSQAAFRFAESLARQHGAKLIVLHVSQTYPGVGGEVPEESLSESARVGMEAIQPSDPNLQLERLFLAGPTAEVIMEYAQMKACDLIVMGTHGRTGLVHALLGSVAEKVVREAPCPVLTVRVPKHHHSEGAS